MTQENAAIRTLPAFASGVPATSLPAQEVAIRAACDALLSPGRAVLWVQHPEGRYRATRRLLTLAEANNDPYLFLLEWRECIKASHFNGLGYRREELAWLSALRRMSVRFVFIEDGPVLRGECRAPEGDIFQLALKRTESFAGGKLVVFSTEPPLAKLGDVDHIVIPT